MSKAAEVKEIFKQLHRNKPKYFNTITAQAPLSNINADLMIMDKISRKPGNKGNKYALVLIDIYSRYLWVVPQKSKTAKTTLHSFLSVFNEKYKPKIITSDNGLEFKGVFASWCKKHSVEQRMVEPGEHTSLGTIDRVIKNLRDKLRFEWAINDNYDWVTPMPKIVNTYNNRVHSTTKQKPVDILKGKAQNEQVVHRSKLIDKFKPGTKVRKLLKRNQFSKGGQQWSKEVYTVKDTTFFKVYLNDGSKITPRDLQISKFEKAAGIKQPKDKQREVTRTKMQQRLLRRELDVDEEQYDKLTRDDFKRPKRKTRKPKRYL